MKKITFWLIGCIIALIVVILVLRFGFNSGEDNWIKNAQGVWSKHGAPLSMPIEVKEQQDAIKCANDKYVFYSDKIEFNSQCLGICGNYAVDIIYVPRNAEDNLPENQCTDFREGKVSKFIELDKNGKIVRIAD